MAFDGFTVQTYKVPDCSQDFPPYAAWPDGLGAYIVLDLRSMTCEAGPFAKPGEALEAMDCLNEQFSTDPQAT